VIRDRGGKAMTVEDHNSYDDRVQTATAEDAENGAGGARSLPGLVALVAAGLFAVLHGTAVGTASVGDFGTATALAWTVIVGTIASLLLGVAAVVLGRGRRWGAIAVVLSLVANPFVLTRVFAFFGG
jgi:hypothetical protein